MEYKTYLFDADGTLFDFDKAEENALIRTFALYDIPYSDDIKIKYRKIGDGLWDLFEKKEISLNELKIRRFVELFSILGINCNTNSFSEKYLSELGDGAFLMNNAYETCQTLHELGKKIYIVTNGFTVVQKRRLELSAIRQFISGLFISEEIGVQKPYIQFFDYIFSYLGELDKRKLIIVGDSLTSDIQGGYNIGIDTCWFNPAYKNNSVGIAPTFEVTDLLEVATLCSL